MKITTKLKNEAIAKSIAAGCTAENTIREFFRSSTVIDGQTVTCAIYYGFMGKNKKFSHAGEVKYYVNDDRVAQAKIDAMFPA